MSTWGDKLRLPTRRIGVGVQVAPENVPQPKEIHYTGFRNGLMFADRPGDVPDGYFAKGLDTESGRGDSIIRAVPISRVELTTHWLDNLLIHTTLDFQSELIAIDPPWFGIIQGGVFQWFNMGTQLDATVGATWVYSNYGDILVFTNGRRSYVRRTLGSYFTTVPDMPAGVSVLAAFGRLFFFGTLTPSGEYNVLGISWNGTGDETDWTGLDAGSELLLSDTSQSDRIVAGRILSYDTVGILCRRSLWIGVRTGVANRPMDPQLRLSGIGCVFEGSARTTEGGITFLSDEGVRHFNGQTAEIISGSINQELLPLNFDEISSYKATWDGGRRRYILCAPCCTFIYQFPTPEYPQGAWFKRIIGLTNVVTFADQTDDPTWNDLGDQTWPGFNDLLWLELATPESNEPPRVLWVSGMQYGVDDPDGDGYFGLIISGLAVPRPIEGQAADDQTHRLMEVKGYLIEHRGSGDVQIIARDELGGYRIVAELSLPLALKTKTTRLDLQHSIRGVGIALRLLSSELEILSVKQVVQDSGPALGDMVTEDDELFDETSEDVYLEADTLVLWR